jgi:hypothetical protein
MKNISECFISMHPIQFTWFKILSICASVRIKRVLFFSFSLVENCFAFYELISVNVR